MICSPRLLGIAHETHRPTDARELGHPVTDRMYLGSRDNGADRNGGVDASVAVTVDCAEDGVANVNSQYGTGDASDVLIGRGDTTQDAGGSPTYSRQFGTMAGMGAATLAITTSPTRGTCETKITDYNGGAVLAESKTAGEVTLTVIVDSGD